MDMASEIPSSATARCILMPELQHYIFDIIHDRPGGPATLAILASTARCFREVALDRLWHTQTSLVPLVKCFPAHLWSEKFGEDGIRTVHFVSEPRETDWARVEFYAPRIRVLSLIPSSATDVFWESQLAGDAYVILRKSRGPTPLLPNLHSFKWTQYQQHEVDAWHETFDVASFSLMLNPQVAHMDVMMFGWSDASAETIASELNRFGRNSDQLRSINIACPSSLPIEEAVLALAYCHQHLRTFIYTWSRGLSVDAIAHLSKMHGLQEVAIRADQEITSRIAELANARGPSFFSSLNALVLHMESLELCKEWLEIIGAPIVNSLTLTVDQVPTAKEFTTFLVHLVEVRQGTLNKLRFVSMTPCLRGSSRHTVMPITLEPLLRLNITHLQLEPGMPIQIDDTFIERMARAWPRLQTLELNAEWRRYSEQPPLVTVPGLLPLTDHCPKLTSLAITFNPDVSAFEERVEAGERPAGGRSFDLNKTFKLGVGASVIDPENTSNLSSVLSDFCPGLMSVETAWGRVGQDDIPGELDDEAEEMAEAWSQVHRYGKEMARVRRQERLWLD